MITPETLPLLREGKNLLAFSAGVDSTALFYLLLEQQIPFDAALVNYKTRPQSDTEAHRAQALCDRFGKRLFLHTAPLGRSNFEASARRVRYGFFESVITAEGYHNLLCAHQLDDWLEWFLMQTAKGAGFFELCGMRVIEERSAYRLIRPLLQTPRARIEQWLQSRSITPFEDESNYDPLFLRNRFRADYARKLMAEYAPGIARTFAALQEDRVRFESSKNVVRLEALTVINKTAPDAAHQIDLAAKRLGHLPSHAERMLIGAQKDAVLGRKIAVGWGEERVFVAPHVRGEKMEKSFKEACRKAGIPPGVRPYLFRAGIAPERFCKP